jgi:hypothetical protein
MKKIINGVRYDTEKMDLIGEACCPSANPGDFQYWEAGLYRAPRSGRFCLAGHGGPMSRFSQSTGQNEWSGGEDLIPMSKSEALDWAEQFLDTDEVEDAFGAEIKDV